MMVPLDELETEILTKQIDDYPPSISDDSFGGKYQDHYDSDQYCDGYQDCYYYDPSQNMD